MPTPNAPPEATIARFRADVLNCGCAISDQPTGICVSGGADSLALLLLAKAALPAIEAATVDHGLRAESAREAGSVGALCAALGVTHSILPLGAPAPGNRSDWARRERYAALRSWVEARSLGVLMTAHHADDQLETVLMRLNRGSGVGGLAGVRQQHVGLCRPLLGWRKAELADIVKRCGIVAVDDPSNRDDAYDRARLRKQLAGVDWLDPQMATRSAAALADADEALDWAATRLIDQHLTADGDVLRLILPPTPRELQRRILTLCLRQINPEADPRGPALDRLLAAMQNGAVMTLAGIKCSGGKSWRFQLAPPRLTN